MITCTKCNYNKYCGTVVSSILLCNKVQDNNNLIVPANNTIKIL